MEEEKLAGMPVFDSGQKRGVYLRANFHCIFFFLFFGGASSNSSLLALHWLAGMEQLTVSLNITHTPKPPYPLATPPSPPLRSGLHSLISSFI